MYRLLSVTLVSFYTPVLIFDLSLFIQDFINGGPINTPLFSYWTYYLSCYFTLGMPLIAFFGVETYYLSALEVGNGSGL